MPKKLHQILEREAKKKGLKGDRKDAYIYGTLYGTLERTGKETSRKAKRKH